MDRAPKADNKHNNNNKIHNETVAYGPSSVDQRSVQMHPSSFCSRQIPSLLLPTSLPIQVAEADLALDGHVALAGDRA